MEFAEGLMKVNNISALRQANLDPFQVASLLNEFSCDMILVHGFVHGDPHSGNVYVRPHPTEGGAELVVLDHGLYHTLADEVRTKLCKLWVSCVSKSQEEKRRLSEELVGPMYKLLPTFLSSWFAIGSLTLEEAAEMRSGRYYSRISLKDATDFLAGMEERKSLLGMFHSSGYTRSLLQDLAYPEQERIFRCALSAEAGLDRDLFKVMRTGEGTTSTKLWFAYLYMRVLFSVYEARIRIFVYGSVYWAYRLVAWPVSKVKAS
mmetsp:Transcript_54/g.184  ORF Transcript_54/g.184 Transcript_54/m.184 type:complete len:262 (+) Transcript_54:915-1700(+)